MKYFPLAIRFIFLFSIVFFKVTGQDKYSFEPSITISNIGIGNPNSLYNRLQFDVEWDFCWRENTGRSNWNAIWVFAKFRKITPSIDVWKHVTLSTEARDYEVLNENGVSPVFAPSSDGKGLFIYRLNTGKDTVRWNSIRIRWNYPEDGLQQNDEIEVKVYVVEMIYIPEGSFLAGDGYSIGRFYDGGNPDSSFRVNESAIILGDTPGRLWADTTRFLMPDSTFGTHPWDMTSDTIQIDYPTGYRAFYAMKYELTQGLYKEFLNTLNLTQAENRISTEEERAMIDSNCNPCRYTIGKWDSVYNTSAATRANNWMNWEDGLAFADWAGLRPMTELEYEKVCRGSGQDVVVKEYSWGDTQIISVVEIQGVDGSGQETAIPEHSNTLYNKTIMGPVMVGIHENKNSRRGRGESYYGAMDMSGNISEMIVSLGNKNGRAFTGIHGDGELTMNGFSDVEGWPGLTSPDTHLVIDGGWGSRGGNFRNSELDLRVSVRNMATFSAGQRLPGNGFRAVRTISSLSTPSGLESKPNKSENIHLFNYPNPFSSSTTIRFEVPIKSHVNLCILDINGRLVKSLIHKYLDKGMYDFRLDAENLSSGIYYCKLQTNESVTIKPIVLIKN